MQETYRGSEPSLPGSQGATTFSRKLRPKDFSRIFWKKLHERGPHWALDSRSMKIRGACSALRSDGYGMRGVVHKANIVETDRAGNEPALLMWRRATTPPVGRPDTESEKPFFSVNENGNRGTG
jgi:hypothetical protein